MARDILNKKGIIQNFSYSMISNLVSLIISTLIIAIVPKVIGVTEYGYYQLYVFYASYIGFFHFGWCDGIYLKYGGIKYDKYDKPLMSSQFWYLSIFELLLTIILFICVIFMNAGTDKLFILSLSIFSILFVIPKTLLSYLLQISNRIKEYSFILIIEKAIYCILTICLLILGCNSYKPLIIVDIIGKIFALFLAIYYCKDIVFTKLASASLSFREAYDNISIGIKLMVANLAGMLILGIIRLGIESQWDIKTFGKISLAISISNLLMVFINAIGVVLFPLLKRIKQEKLNYIYISIRDSLMIILFGMLICYYPLQIVLSKWLPSYAESFEYMSVLFPMCIYESKMSMLINTYLKTLRKEKQLLFINALTVLFSFLLTYLFVYLYKNINLTIISIVVLFGFRCIYSELVLGRFMRLNFKKEIIIEICMCGTFIFINYKFKMIFAFFLYIITYLIYLIYKRKSFIQILSILK